MGMSKVKEQDKVAKKADGTLKPKYKDLPRFPAVQNGYEKDFRESYQGMIATSTGDITKLIKKVL